MAFALLNPVAISTGSEYTVFGDRRLCPAVHCFHLRLQSMRCDTPLLFGLDLISSGFSVVGSTIAWETWKVIGFQAEHADASGRNIESAGYACEHMGDHEDDPAVAVWQSDRVAISQPRPGKDGFGTDDLLASTFMGYDAYAALGLRSLVWIVCWSFWQGHGLGDDHPSEH
jgi:hypothetical protein